VSISTWISSSVASFSTRAIAWICRSIVSRFSNMSAMIVPNDKRRLRLISITDARNPSRPQSYSRRSAMSASASLRMLVWGT